MPAGNLDPPPLLSEVEIPTREVAAMTCRIVPALRYRDGPRAIEWLGSAFGFEPRLVVPADDGGIAHAQLVRGDVMIMLSSSHEGEYHQHIMTPAQVNGYNTQSPYIVVEDPDAVYEAAMAAGAEVVIELKDEEYGGRGFTCRDPEGHFWSFGSYDPWAEPAT
jgi:uncharacterized glyoxalase superfamily protein PhnB